MAEYTLKFYDIRDMSASRTGIIKDGPDGAPLSTYLNQSFSWDGSVDTAVSSTTIVIRDDDSTISGTPDASQQDLVKPLMGDGRTLSTGTKVYAAYSYSFSAGGATQYIYAIVANGSNDVIGFISTYDLVAGAGYTITAVSNTPGSVGYSSFVPCFVRGTLIATVNGPVAIEDLVEGDLVLTRDNGPQPLRWIGVCAIDPLTLVSNARIRPIRIRQGALGGGLPTSDLLVSPQHRILVRSKIAQKMFGTDEILVAAKQLCQIEGIDIADDLTQVDYFHMLFDRHEVVISNGAETESLFTGPEALKAVGPAARDEIFAIFPELADRDYTPTAARVLASGRMGRKLAVRHANSNKSLVRH